MNDVIEVWYSFGENLEAIAYMYIVLEIQSLEARRVGWFRCTHSPGDRHLLWLL